MSDDAGDVVDVLFQQHLQLEQRLNAVFRRSAAPLGKGGRGGFDGRIHIGRIRPGERWPGFRPVAGLTTSRHSDDCADSPIVH